MHEVFEIQEGATVEPRDTRSRAVALRLRECSVCQDVRTTLEVLLPKDPTWG